MTILQGNCLAILPTLSTGTIDACVTDPPYGLRFMGKSWDYDVPTVAIWKEVFRVLKPGGYLLSFAGTRTQHRMAVNIEDAGFEIRDMIAWVYGSGFPKSLNIGKAVDKIQGNKRDITGSRKADDIRANNLMHRATGINDNIHTITITKGSSAWEGWGTALKPALEPITVARKPISENTVALNVLKWGTGGINIDGSRVELAENDNDLARMNKTDNGMFGIGNNNNNAQQLKEKGLPPVGRFPANLIHDGSEEVMGVFPSVKGQYGGIGKAANSHSGKYGWNNIKKEVNNKGAIHGVYDFGSAARFFYCAKASREERNRGCETMNEKTWKDQGFRDNESTHLSPRAGAGRLSPMKNYHPTVKPVSLMRYLCKLVTPPGGTVLDPFMGSGSTGIAAKMEGYGFIGIELEAEYVKIAKARIAAWEHDPEQFRLF